MPATAADIAAGSRDASTASWADATLAARYVRARDGSLEPAPGFFDAIADAQTVVNARGALIGTERRRFAVTAADLVWPDLSAGVPSAQLIDAEQGANGAFLVARVELDLEAETTAFEVFG